MIRRGSLLLLLGGLAACGPRQQRWLEFPIPREAEALTVRQLPQGEGEQCDFRVERPYPYDGVHEFYRDSVREPWRRCPASQERWEAVGAGTRRQRSSSWIDEGKQRYFVVASWYDGDGEQRVMLRYIAVGDPREWSFLQALCRGATPPLPID
ncbi:MAG TPA: hypothetical protein VJS92_08375 [Candidatus Polarisedimenticolaceae bacterium]|nr:hypothetical protein [Candidatus Polarisedimenticolaceae bacterium]